MVVKKMNLQRISNRPTPETLTELLDELAQFTSDGKVGLLYQSQSTAAADFFAIVNSSLTDLIHADEEVELDSGGWDIQLDGEAMGSVFATPEESARDVLKLCYQVGMLRMYGERGASDYDIDHLSKEMDEEWDFEISREKLKEELI